MTMLPKLHETPLCWLGAAIRTLDAPRWTLWMARLFGRRFTGEDKGHTIVGYEWRGKLYMTNYHRPAVNAAYGENGERTDGRD